MGQKQKLILALAVLAGLLAMYTSSHDASAPQAESVEHVNPAVGMVGGTTQDAAEKSKEEVLSERDKSAEIGQVGEQPPAPAAQLAPITQGAGDVVDDVPAGAVVGEQPQPEVLPQGN